MRRKAKVDSTQPAIVDALKKAGATVQHLHAVGAGCPDLLAGFRGQNFLLEVKPDFGSPSSRKLRKNQQEWHEGWKGHVAVVETPGAALAVIGAIGCHRAGVIGGDFVPKSLAISNGLGENRNGRQGAGNTETALTETRTIGGSADAS
jgi:hypothetical protein